MKQDRLICLIVFLLLWSNSSGVVGPASPCPGKGLHVLIVEDRLQRGDLPAEQLSGMMSVELDDLITAKHGRKFLYDLRQDVSAKEEWVQKAMALPRDALPWVVLDHNGRGTSQPAPKNLAEFKKLVESF